MEIPEWQWNEFSQAGTDYADPHEVEIYETRMLEFRDIPAENRVAIEKLAIPADGAVMEIGCGTGLFSRTVAPNCGRVTACDVSEMMLRYASMKAEAAGLDNITFKHNGFLTLCEPAGSYDAVMSSLALHHLPDFWKAAAVRKIYDALKVGGRFYLYDVVFATETGENEFEYMKQRVVPAVPEAAYTNFMRHIRQEYSTLDWIMSGILERAGFTILENNMIDVLRTIRCYLCEKR